jgi:precorrin-3B synthase
MNRDLAAHAVSQRRRGFCPGVWTPMESGDGLIVRIRSGAWGLSSQKLRALARLARSHGSGIVELTRRANLQLRGVRPAELAPLQAALVEHELADASPAREARLAGLLMNPLVLLGSAGADLALLCTQLEHALCAADDALVLPAKFALVLDAHSGAGGLLDEVSADLRLTLRDDGRLDLSVGGTATCAQLVGVCALHDAPGAVLALLARLSAAQAEGPVRMRALWARDEAELAAVVGPWIARDEPGPIATTNARTRERPSSARALSHSLGLRHEPVRWLGVALPFGAGEADTWEALAALAEQHGRGELWLTPRRTVVVPGVDDDRSAWHTLAQRHGLILDHDDPRLRAIACPGAPSCGSAHGETRALASSLARLLAPGQSLHVSGCAKGCAASAPADFTLVHGADGCRLGLGQDVASTALLAPIPLETARGRLTALASDVRVRPLMKQYDYVRDGAEIYRRSFAIIRSEARLARFSPIEERVAVRLIHTSGMVELADDIVFSPGFAQAASAAIRAGAPILCDANMIVSGVTRARLGAHNDVLCFLNDPTLPALARAQRTTRSAAALSLWGERLNGAVVAIGNAPTALFRLLELLDETDLRPAAVIGLPVGFVGAAESKDALLADGRVPCMIVRGRRGGSAMTVAAINALASDEE